MNRELENYLLKATTKAEWEEIWSMVKARYGQWESSLSRNFRVGDKVKFYIPTGRYPGHYSGTIQKMTPQTAKIITINGVEWTVNFSFLEKQI